MASSSSSIGASRSLSWGLVADQRGKPFVNQPAGDHWRLLPALNSVISDSFKSVQSPFNWTAIQINIDFASTWHTDDASIGWSAIFALGEFTGGQFETKASGGVSPMSFDIHDHIVRFDGGSSSQSGASHWIQDQRRRLPRSITRCFVFWPGWVIEAVGVHHQ